MSRRFLVAVACLSASVGVLLTVVIGGSLSPGAAISSPAVRTPAAHTDRGVAPATTHAPSFADAAERVNPAVVNIDALSHPAHPPRFNSSARNAPELFERPPNDERDRLRRGTGAGFLIDGGWTAQ